MSFESGASPGIPGIELDRVGEAALLNQAVHRLPNGPIEELVPRALLRERPPGGQGSQDHRKVIGGLLHTPVDADIEGAGCLDGPGRASGWV